MINVLYRKNLHKFISPKEWEKMPQIVRNQYNMRSFKTATEADEWAVDAFLVNSEKKVYKVIKEFSLEKGYAPSYEEISYLSGLNSKSTISALVKRLMAKGFLESDSVTRDDIIPTRGVRIHDWEIILKETLNSKYPDEDFQ